MNHFHSTDAPVTDRPRRLGTSARMAQRLTARGPRLCRGGAGEGLGTWPHRRAPVVHRVTTATAATSEGL
ncbi:unnamed protein product [Leuciscus chuanchicus]